MTKIQLDAIYKTYPKQVTPALAGVTLDIATGESVALFGPSGSGKSTLLKIIAGIESCDAGDVRFDGKSILPVAAHTRGAVLMFQKAYLFPFLSVEANIGFGLKMKRVGRSETARQVQHMLELVGLPEMAQRMPSQLSGGQQQRVALARALITKPSVLMLDEPLSNLDSAVRVELQEVIRRIQRELGITMLLVTHELTEAMSMSDRMAILLSGRVEAYGTPSDIYTHPPTRAAAQAVGVRTFLAGELDGTCLQTAIGNLQVCTTAGHPRSALFAIRPEHLQLQCEPSNNTVSVQVQDCVYRGEYMEYLVSMHSHSFRARSVQHTHRIGDAAWLSMPAQHLFEVTDPP